MSELDERPVAQSKPRILFVEDESAVREHIASVLGDEYVVDTAADGGQALLAVMRTRPELVITDVMMPGIDGIELLKTLRSTPNTQRIPVLLISGRAPDEMRIEGFEEGADGYLAKPYVERELRARIRSMLQTARVREDAARREALAEAERHSMAERAALLESITDGFYAVDRQGRFRYINQRALETFGRSREELIGKNIWQVFRQAEGTVLKEQIDRALEQGVAAAFEFLSPRSNRWFEINLYPTPQGLAANFRDISDRKHTEREREELKSQLAADLAAMSHLHQLSTDLVKASALPQMLEAILDGVIALQGADFGNVQLFDPEQQLLRIAVHRGFEQAFLDAFRETRVTDDCACGRALRTRMRVIIEDVQTDPGFEPYREIASQAGYRAVQSTPMLDRYGKPIGMLSTHFRQRHRPDERVLRLTDLYLRVATELIGRRQDEEARRQAEERYRAFVANSSEGIWRYELDEPLNLSLSVDEQIAHIYRHARLAELNDAMARMYGYERADEMTGWSLEKTLPLQDEAALAYLRHAVESGFFLADVESAERDREGRVRYFANSMVPVIENGKLLRVWGMQRDTTDAKQSAERLREADRRKDEFLAVLAHELRNPLAPIRNGLHILRLRASSDSALQGTVSMMDRQMSHMVRLVDDLLDVSRITQGRLELRSQLLRLTDVLASAVESARAQIEAHGHDLQLDVRNEGVLVHGDADRLAQVFANLLSNSAKYTDRGGVIRVTAKLQGEQVVVSVRDTGIGIPPHALEQVFDLFSQVRSHQARADGGLGIGLSLVRSLVDLHGGTVAAHSEGVGKGSTFTVRLPLHGIATGTSPGTASAPGAGDPDRNGRRRLRVLVADDNADAARSLASLLDLDGHEVRTASDGVQAVSIAADFKPDLIFMDLGMPHMDGIEATRRIRALAGVKARIVALTGWAQELDRERTRAAGMDDHLTKPVSLECLQSVVAASVSDG